MRWVIMSVAALVVGLVVNGTVLANGPKGQGNPGMNGMKSMSKPNSMPNKNFFPSRERTFRSWSSCYWNAQYRCYCFWDPTFRCYYYYYGPRGCFLPVTQIVVSPPIVTQFRATRLFSPHGDRTRRARPAALGPVAIGPRAESLARLLKPGRARQRRRAEDAQGRPVGVAMDSRGALLVADDVGNTVWRVSQR